MKYSKKTREEAALLLGQLASQQGWRFFIDEMHQFTDSQRSLAKAAWGAVTHRYSADQWRETYAEAEALIRTGWPK